MLGTLGEFRNQPQLNNADVLVIGAGQAGLSTAYHLARRGIRHVIVDGEDVTPKENGTLGDWVKAALEAGKA